LYAGGIRNYSPTFAEVNREKAKGLPLKKEENHANGIEILALKEK